MKNLTSFLLITLISILLVQTVQGQTEEEFTQEFQQYAETYGVEAARDYALNRFAQITANSLLEEAAWVQLETSFGAYNPCLATRRQICDLEYQERVLDISAVTTAAGVACALAAGGNPVVFAFCIAAVAYQHIARMEAARRAHQACYLRARLDCPDPTPTPTPNPNHCAILAPEKVPGTDDILPSLADCSLYEDPCLCPLTSPILVDVAGNGFDLTNVAGGVMFNITGFGRQPLGWTRADSDDAFLALDLNANGLIDNGAELFGNFTTQPEPLAGAERNGFAALAVFDNNGDDTINGADSVYSVLRLWQDRNHNGMSEANELHSLADLSLTTLELKYKESKQVDKYGNKFRYRGKVKDTHNTQLGRWAWDVFLVNSRLPLSN